MYVLYCFALFVCLTLLASFFLPSRLSLKHVCMYVYMHARVCMYVCMHICMHACMHVYVCMYVCTYVCMSRHNRKYNNTGSRYRTQCVIIIWGKSRYLSLLDPTALCTASRLCSSSCVVLPVGFNIIIASPCYRNT